MITNLVYDAQKDRQLRLAYGLSFAEAKLALAEGIILDLFVHPEYAHEQIITVEIKQQHWLIPFIYLDAQTILLKTLLPVQPAAIALNAYEQELVAYVHTQALTKTTGTVEVAVIRQAALNSLQRLEKVTFGLPTRD